MKKRLCLLSTIVLIIGAGYITSCDKIEDNNPVMGFKYDTNSKIEYSKIQNLDISSFRGGSGCTEILVFDNMETFKNTIHELERQVNEYDSAFVAFFSDLNEEQLYQKEQEIGYSESQPMADFEEYYNFLSINAAYQVAESAYLEQGDLNIVDDPDNLFLGADEERCFLNAGYEVMINDTIYKLTEVGYFEISDGDFTKLSLLNDLDNLPENVSYVGENKSNSKSANCRLTESESHYESNSSNTRRIKCSLQKTNNFWGSSLYAKTTNYKKKSNGKWRKYRTTVKAGVEGNGYEPNCGLNQHIYAYEVDSKNKKTVRERIYVFTYNEYIQTGEVKGYHYGAGGIQYNSTLTW